jgi:hypothetical protein
MRRCLRFCPCLRYLVPWGLSFQKPLGCRDCLRGGRMAQARLPTPLGDLDMTSTSPLAWCGTRRLCRKLRLQHPIAGDGRRHGRACLFYKDRGIPVLLVILLAQG